MAGPQEKKLFCFCSRFCKGGKWISQRSYGRHRNERELDMLRDELMRGDLTYAEYDEQIALLGGGAPGPSARQNASGTLSAPGVGITANILSSSYQTFYLE